MSTFICDIVSFAKFVLLRQFPNICGYGTRRSNIIDDTCGYVIPRCNIVLKLALFIGTVFTLINIDRKIKSLRNGTTELRRPKHKDDNDEHNNDNNSAVSALKEFYERKFDDLGMEIQLLQSENSRLRATLMEKEDLFDQMAADTDGLRRKVIENFKGRMEQRSPLPSRSFQEEEDDFSVLTLRQRMDRLDQENHQLRKENTEHEAKIEDLEKEVVDFVKQNENIKTEFEKERGEIKNELESKIRHLMQDLSDIHMRMDRQFEMCKHEVIEKDEKIQDLEKEIQKLAEEKMEVKTKWKAKFVT
ncbi:tropomyosin-like [Macrobrachium rosenbergii]|uniref:tropomyosin-like n=1 Tax=Macrobrachium rosenbergii TaxID=79674 RepID=UPI0034D6FAE1